MRIVIVIPARYESKRFPGKPLTLLKNGLGQSNPLIYWTHRVASFASRLVKGSSVYVATDDARIERVVKPFGNVLMTSTAPENGTERCFEVVEELNLSAHDIVVNWQGDAPLIPADYATRLINWMIDSNDVDVATAVVPLTRDEIPTGTVTCAVGEMSRAMYFSRNVLPHGGHNCLAHAGLYAYRVHALERYALAAQGQCERAEKLEQLRWIEQGLADVICVAVDPINDREGNRYIPPEVNCPTDKYHVEAFL